MILDKNKRYERQTSLSNVGLDGLEKLKKAKILIVGAGGLGAPVLLYLAGSGIGCLGISDSDKVDITNLQRQIIYNEDDIGTDKTICSKKKLLSLNSDIEVIVHPAINSKNILSIIKGYDFIIEATDDISIKYLINDVCQEEKIPFSFGGVLRYKGQTMTVLPSSPSYRDIFPKEPKDGVIQTCSEAGVLGVVPGVIGMIQATEALKYILNIGDLLVGKLLLYDALTMEFKTIKIS